jgi:hypothetical protein
MRPATRILTVALLSLALGAHWAVLQCVAWTTMLVERVQTQTFATALRTTFDGQHPCELCLVVRQAKAAADSDAVPSARVAKPEVWVRLEAVPSVPDAGRPAAAYPPVVGSVHRSDRPPVPPPRPV